MSKKDITLKEHLTKISHNRWKDVDIETRRKHGKMMSEKRWKKKPKDNQHEETKHS